MLNNLFAIALTIASLNNAKPKQAINGAWKTPQILNATSQAATDIMTNSYFYKLNWSEFLEVETDLTEENFTIDINMIGISGEHPHWIRNYEYNSIYFLLHGRVFNYEGQNDQAYDLLVNPYGIWSNDGDYQRLYLNEEDLTNTDDLAPYVKMSILDGYELYGLILPKGAEDLGDNVNVNMDLFSIKYTSDQWKRDSNPKGINPNFETPKYIEYNQYSPLKQKANYNYLTGSYGSYTAVDDGFATGTGHTADENMYYFDALFNNSLFVNGYTGVGNNAVNIMYLQYPAGPDYKYVGLFNGYNYYYHQATYNNAYIFFNYEFNRIGGFSYAYSTYYNYNYWVNKPVNDTDNTNIALNVNTWLGNNANRYVVLEPSKNDGAQSQMEILKSHLISGYVSGDNSENEIVSGGDAITLGNGDIGDVFNLLAMAFSGIGGFMSILILPGITLGALFVMPLITSLLIWLITLFKRH